MEINWRRGSIIGRGSTATVSLAISSSGELFAVKSAEFSSSAILQKEKSILSALNSPYVVKYIGSDLTQENDELVYNILMEYVSGGNLHELIKNSGGKLPEPAIRSYTRQVLEGLMYLHGKGIVHCDLKSENVMVGENGVVSKIGDLGCAKVEQELGISGTPAFMAPEVVRGEEQGFPADVWALGCMVIEMMTGLTPWPEINDVVAAIYKIGFSGESPEIPGWISEKGKDFLKNCFWKDPKLRWTVEELLQHPFLDEEEEESQSSPSTVLDQHFWDLCETSKSHLISMNYENPIANFSELRDLQADRIKKLTGDGFTGVPNWDMEEDSGWIQVRGDRIRETEKRDEDGEEDDGGDGGEEAIWVETTSVEAFDGVWNRILNEDDRLIWEYSSDDIINDFYSNLIVFYCYSNNNNVKYNYKNRIIIKILFLVTLEFLLKFSNQLYQV